MITRLLILLAVFCCFSFSSNAQTTNADGSITIDNQLGNSDFDQSVFSSQWNWWQNSGAGVGHTYANDKYVSFRDGGMWQTFGLPELLNPSNQVILHWSLEVWKLDLQDLFEVRVGFGDGNQNPTDWASVLNLEGENTSGWETFSGNEIFNSISNNALTAGIWMEGKDRDGGSWASGRYPTVDDVRLSMTYFEGMDCSNPLNDPSCDGYEQAYTEQQCQQDPLYDQSCSGYEQAYLDQQCQQDTLYDSSCPGYEQAYEDQQCSNDALWSPKCQGYYQAYEQQQCDLDSQYSFTCPNFKFEEPEEFKFERFTFEDFSGSDTGSDYDAFGNVKEEFTFEEEFKFDEPMPFSEPFKEEFVFEERFIFEEEFVFEEKFTFDEPEIDFKPELDEFIPEDIKEAIAELEKRIEEKEEQEKLEEIFEEFAEELMEDDIKEEIEENVVALTETTAGEIPDEGGTSPTPRRSGSRIGLSVGLNTANSLVSNLISRSIESGLSDAAQGVGSGGFYGSDTQNMANLAATGGNFADFTNNVTSDQQNDMNIAVDLGVGPTISLGNSVNLGNMTLEIVREPSLAEKMAEKVRKKNLDNQKGIFNKQITMLENIANGNNLNKYYDERLSDASDWYGAGQVYAGNKISDKDSTYYGLNAENYGIMKQLIRSQY